MERLEEFDAFFTFVFGLETLVMIVIAATRPWMEGAYFDLGPAFIIIFGLLLPGGIYLTYKGLVLAIQWWKNKNLSVAWRHTFRLQWARRSAYSFLLSISASAAYLFLARVSEAVH